MKKNIARRRAWGGRTFRFKLSNFRLSEGVSIRRFSIVEASLLLMVALITSRVLGVVRQLVINSIFGATNETAAYIAASRLPDTLFNLIAGGALISAFVPVFLSFEREQGQEEAWRLTSLVFNLLLVLLVLITIIGEAIAPFFVTQVLVPHAPAIQPLTISLTRIMLLQPLILGIGTIVSAILNSKRQFLLPAVSLAVYNVGVLGGLVVTKLVPGVGIYGPTYGTIAAVVLQLLVQLPGLFKQRVRYSFLWDLRNPGLRQVAILLVPNALAVGVASFANIIDTNYASILQAKDAASIASLQNAEMLQALPLALIAQAVGQSMLPHLAAQAASGRFVRMRQTALKVIGGAMALTIPALLALIALGQPVIHILFKHGAFTTHAANLTYLALIGYAFALPGLAAGPLLSSAFFALKDAVTPFVTNTYALFARWGLLIVFFTVFQGQDLILAVPLAIVGSATTEALLLGGLLLFRLRRRIKFDQGMHRLLRRRTYQQSLPFETAHQTPALKHEA